MIKTLYISKVGKDYKVSPHFRLIELASPKIGGGYEDKVIFDTSLLKKLEQIRAAFGGYGIDITSGYRTTAYNKSIGGASNSAHLYGRAIDFKVKDKNGYVSSKRVCVYLQDKGWTKSIGYMGMATHIDNMYKNLMDETKKPYLYLNRTFPGKNFRQYFDMPLGEVKVTKGSNVRTGAGIQFRKKDYVKRGEFFKYYDQKKSRSGSLWIKKDTYRWVYKGNTEKV